MNDIHQADDLIHIFNACFLKSHHTLLAHAQDEPLYLPADHASPFNRVLFAHGYFSSALHECAHWLIAGEARRQKIDYGYWYLPDGRNDEQQTLFQQVEARPQALEWLLSEAAGFGFSLSFDNLNGNQFDARAFEDEVIQKKRLYQAKGLPPRAQTFYTALSGYYKLGNLPQPSFA